MEILQPDKEVFIIDAPKGELEVNYAKVYFEQNFEFPFVLQLKKEYLQKCEEVLRLKQQISSRDKIIKELESQVHRLKLKMIN